MVDYDTSIAPRLEVLVRERQLVGRQDVRAIPVHGEHHPTPDFGQGVARGQAAVLHGTLRGGKAQRLIRRLAQQLDGGRVR